MSRERQAWILNYIARHGDVSIVDEKFVSGYIEAFKHKIKVGYQPFGANTVPDLSRQLSALFNNGQLQRVVWGAGQRVVGFPSWWYVYYLPERNT